MIGAIIVIGKQKDLSRALRGFVITMLVLAVSLATFYEYSISQAESAIRPTITAFKQGKELKCKDQIISTKNYSFEPGTSTFQPLLNVVGETYSVSECQLAS